MRTLLVAALLAGSAFHGGVATAANDDCWVTDPPPDPCPVVQGWCDYDVESLSVEDTGGPATFTGMVAGYALSDLGQPGAVTIQCYLVVNGVVLPPTPPGTGTVFAATADQVTFTATGPLDVDVCAEWTTNGGPARTSCRGTTTYQIPPQAVIDQIDGVFAVVGEVTQGFDPIVCGALMTAGVPGIVNATTAMHGYWMDWDDCDVWGSGERMVDFVPYDDPE